MAGISWNSSSINSFFNSSFKTGTTSSFYSSLGDAALIKSGSYKKLMRSYFNDMEEYTKDTGSKKYSSSKKSSSSEDKVSSSSSSKSRHACTYTYDSQAKTISTVRNKVLDELLDKKPKKSSITNPVLDDLLNKNKKETADGTVTEKTDTTTPSNTSSSAAKASEATAGTIMDAAV